jgi:hypothetical protein
MVEEALKRLSEQQIIELDEEHKASMINNSPTGITGVSSKYKDD